MVYGFKYHKRDPFVHLPCVSGFYAFLASLLLSPDSKQDVRNLKLLTIDR